MTHTTLTHFDLRHLINVLMDSFYMVKGKYNLAA